MKVLRYDDADFATHIRNLQRHATPDPQVEATVREVLAAVRDRGNAALIELTERFGGPLLSPGDLRIFRQPGVDPTAESAIALAHANVLAFARRSLRASWSMANAQGAEVGERFDPFGRVGIYVPGGTAPLVSTAIMTCTLAQAAGCPEIVVTTPSDANGQISDALLHALTIAGATEIYQVGGAQAIAALAYGTETIKPVQKVFGPGNAYVVEAKRQVFGTVAIDLLPGPSEIMVLADVTANPHWIAADLLAQAEHGKGSRMIFVTDSEWLLSDVEREISAQTGNLRRQEHLAPVLAEGATLVLTRSLFDGIEIVNEFAPEHLTIVALDEDELAKQVSTAGAIFLGAFSPVAAGDFVAGPSHTLPTGGAGKSFSGLTADMFQRRTSIIRLGPSSLECSLRAIETFSALEGLDAHGRSATIRLGREAD